MYKKFILAALLLVAGLVRPGATAQAQGNNTSRYPVVTSQCEPTSVTVGDHVRFTVRAVVPELQRLVVRDPFSDKDQTTWTLVGKPVVTDEKLSANEWRRNTESTLTTFELGEVELPPVEVRYQPPGNGDAVVRTVSWVHVNVHSVLPADAASVALADIKDPVPLPLPSWVSWVVGSVVAALFALLAFLLWRHLRGRIGNFINPQLRPDEWALLQVEELEREKLIEQKKLKELYTRLSDTLRQYLGKAYDLNAMDMTTGELLAHLEELEYDEPSVHRGDFHAARQRLSELLDEADLVKFAQFLPEPSRSRHALEKAREVVRLSRYKFEPAPVAGDPAEPPSAPAAPPPPPPPAARMYDTGQFAAAGREEARR